MIRAIKAWISLNSDLKRVVNGDADAQFRVGNAYALLGDYIKAAEWHERASIQDHAGAKHMLALACLEGKGISQDYDKARELLIASAEQGYIEAQFDLGGLYAQGVGIPTDYEEARRWWQLAASLGHPSAEKNLSILMKRIRSD